MGHHGPATGVEVEVVYASNGVQVQESKSVYAYNTNSVITVSGVFGLFGE